MDNYLTSTPLSRPDASFVDDTTTLDLQNISVVPAGRVPVLLHATMHTRDSSTSSANSIAQHLERYDFLECDSGDATSPFGSNADLSRSRTILSPTHSRGSTSSQTSYSPMTPDCSIGYSHFYPEKLTPRSITASCLPSVSGSNSSAPNASVDLTPNRSMLADAESYSPKLSSRPNDDQDLRRKQCSITCVSSPERSKQSKASPKFWCTACKRDFVNKSDWMAHEEKFQEWFEMYSCDKCDMFFFNKGKYVRHHKNKHECPDCNDGDNAHASAARKTRKGREAWGCGFCCHYDTDWKKRCAHIASQHFNATSPRARKTIKDWNPSQVIRSLLSRPGIAEIWENQLNGADNTVVAWDDDKTGRAEGYPDSKRKPQLQDLLEWHTNGTNPSKLIYKAFRESNVAPRQGPTGAQHGNWNMQAMNPPSMGSVNPRMTRLSHQYHTRGHSLDTCINYSRPLPTQKIYPLYGEQLFTANLGPPIPPKEGFNMRGFEAPQLPLDITAPWTSLENTIVDDRDYFPLANMNGYYDAQYDNDHAQK